MYRRGGSLHRRIQAGRSAANRTRFDDSTTVRLEPVDAARTDWPAIVGAHPTWWRVHRIELADGVRRAVLIAERRTLQGALNVARVQQHQCTVARTDDGEPFTTNRDPLVVGGAAPGGTSDVDRRDP